MATACLFLGWNRPSQGQYKEAFSFLMGESLERLETWKKQGWYESRDIVGITPHSGTLNGCLILRGERAKLDELRRTDEFERFSMRMNMLFEGYGVMPGVTEEGMRKVMERNPDFMK